MKQKSLRLLVLAMAAGTMQWQPAYADPVDVSYTVSGSPGAWVLDFSVTNNLGGTNSIYYLNVGLPTTSIVGSPAGWAYSSANNPWSNAAYGGSSVVYNNPWRVSGNSPVMNPGAMISSGQTLSGFEVLDTDLVAPASVLWTAFATLGTYNGPGCFSCGVNPGFEGVGLDPPWQPTTPLIATPLPAALPLFAGGLGALGLLGWRRKRKAVVLAR
jgi:hypothetical protein